MEAKTVHYSDFNCPFCYANEERIAALGATDQVEWRGVEHAPHLPQPMQPAPPDLAAELKRESEILIQIAPELPIRELTAKPNTRPAILGTITALRIDQTKGKQLKSSLYRAVWRDGLDVSEPSVLTELAAAAGFDPDELAPTHEDAAKLMSWRESWAETNIGAVPMIVDPTRHTALPGLQTTETLAALLGVPVEP